MEEPTSSLGGHNLFADERLEIVMLSNSELHLDIVGGDKNDRLKVILVSTDSTRCQSEKQASADHAESCAGY